MRSRQNLNQSKPTIIKQDPFIFNSFSVDFEAKKKKNLFESNGFLEQYQNAIEKEGVAHETGDFLQRTP